MSPHEGFQILVGLQMRFHTTIVKMVNLQISIVYIATYLSNTRIHKIKIPFIDFWRIFNLAIFGVKIPYYILFTHNIWQFRPGNTFFRCIRDFDQTFLPMCEGVGIRNCTKVTSLWEFDQKIT